MFHARVETLEFIQVLLVFLVALFLATLFPLQSLVAPVETVTFGQQVGYLVFHGLDQFVTLLPSDGLVEELLG